MAGRSHGMSRGDSGSLPVWWSSTPALVLWVLALAGCTTTLTDPVPSGPPEPRAVAVMQRGLEAFRAGDLRAAQARFRSAILLDDSLVKAHIHYQNTWIARARRGTARAEYRSRIEKDPSGYNLYLYGRLMEEPRRKLEFLNRAAARGQDLAWVFLERAVALENWGRKDEALADMDHAVALLPLDSDIQVNRGYFFLRRRQPHRAMDCFSKAIRLDGKNHRAYFGLYRTHAQYNASRNALRCLKECLFLQPTRGLYLVELRKYAERHANFTDLGHLEKVVLKVTEDDPENTEALQTLGWLRDRTGRPFSALDLLTRADRLEGLEPRTVRNLLRIHVRMGQYDKALERFLEYIPPAILLGPKNRLRSRWLEVVTTTRAATEAPTGPALTRLARAYSRVGWVEEALQVYDRLRVVNPHAPGLDREVQACTCFLNLVEVMRNYFENLYRTFKKGGDPGDLEDVLRDFARYARLNAGIDDPGPLPLKSFSLIGAVMDRDEAETHPLARYFDRFNHYFILGQRGGSPPEAMISGRLCEEKCVTRPRFGRTVSHRFILAHHVRVRSYRESLDQNLGGVTIGRELFVNLDFIHQWRRQVLKTYRDFSPPEMLADLFHDPAESAASRNEALDTSNPLSTKQRIYYLFCRDAGKKAGDVALFLDMVRTHEEGHVLDAERYLPILSNLWRVLGLALKGGFSTRTVEGFLEGNAEITAMAEGPAPRLSLAQIIGFLPSPESAPPHSLGYHDIVSRIVEEVYDEAERYPRVDRNRNILQQLHLLEPGDLRRLARKIAGERHMRQ